MNKHSTILFLLLALLPASLLHAQRTLLAGDTLRGYYLGAFVQGEEPEGGLDGSWVVMDFWATWCRPCVAAMPHLNELQKEFASDSVVFLAVTHERKQQVQGFLTMHELLALVALDSDKQVMHKLMGIRAIPRTFVIGPDRVIRWTGHPSKLGREELRAILTGAP